MPENKKDGTRRPDAVLVARTYPPGKAEMARHIALQAEFGPVFGCRRILAAQSGTLETLIVPYPSNLSRPMDSRFFAQGHDLEGEDRYHWFVARRGESGEYEPLVKAVGDPDEMAEVKLGYLREEAIDKPAVVGAEPAENSLEARIRHQAGSADLHEELSALGIRALPAQTQVPSRASDTAQAAADLPGSTPKVRRVPK